MKSKYEQIKEVLKAHDAWCEISDLSVQDDKVIITIEWGDWKHSHIYVDYIMQKHVGYVLYNEKVTETDGSDCYSSIHYYKQK